MQYLKVTNLTKSYIVEKPLVDSVDFVIEKGQKVALVARNGAGKSTLLKLILGELDKTDGEIEFRKGVKIGFLSQEMGLDKDQKVIDVLFDSENELAQLVKSYEKVLVDPNIETDKVNAVLNKMEEMKAWEYEAKVKKIVSKLQITPYLEQKVGSLSGGEKKRVQLAKILADNPDFLIFDEPTNHLDLQMIEWLEDYLKKSEITLLMVTHDRYFLERICSDIFELDRGKLYFYPGNYEYFLKKKTEREEIEKIEMKNLRKLLKQELAWIRKPPRARASKSVFREKRFYDIEDEYDTRKVIIHNEKKPMEIEMEERRLGGKILKIHNLQKKFGDKTIINNFSHDFRHGERIGVIGKNGVGKSTFLNMIMGKEKYDCGKIVSGETVVHGYYQQKEIAFPSNKRVIDVVREVAEFMYVAKGQKLTASHLLEKFLFPPQQQYMMADALSGGEKRRLYLLTILMKNPNFLILDEPTNDLDLMTLAVLQDFLLQYQGCLIVVSHDRFFMDRVVDHLFVFEGEGVVEDFWGTYSEYKEKKNEEIRNKKVANGDGGEATKRKSKVGQERKEKKKKLSYIQQREFDQIMVDIEKLEKRKEEINLLFDDSNLPYDDIKTLSEELGEVTRQIEIKEMRRMELSEKIF